MKLQSVLVAPCTVKGVHLPVQCITNILFSELTANIFLTSYKWSHKRS